jgi:trehalose-phosphatase
MQVLTAGLSIESLKARIARANARVLMLDYDGTLAPFHVRPDLARPYPEASDVLRDIAAIGRTRVVIVSGRPADEIPPLLGLSPRPEIWGSHGRERLAADGKRSVVEAGNEARSALDEAARAVEHARAEGARIERKLASVALHWRGVDDAGAQRIREDAERRWSRLTREGQLELLPFDGGLEIRARGYTKADAVYAVLAESASDSAVAYLGDDVTDEDAFRAIKPRGVAVLVRSELRQTAADVWLRPPHELASFLELWSAPN